MFDWNDEELTNIIWGKAGDCDDHIVPYPDSNEGYCNKKEWVQESCAINSSEQKASGAVSNLPAKKLDGSSNFDPGEGTSSSRLQMNTWSHPSLLNAPKSDCDSLGKSVSENLTQIYKFDSQAETTQMDKNSGVFQTPKGGKNQDDFVDCGWDGSFDDLDQIFSDDDPIFGNVNLGNDDELWSSKDITNNQVKSFVDSPSLGLGALRDGSEHFDIKGEYMQEDDQTFTLDYGKDDDTMSHSLQSACAMSDRLDYAGDERKSMVKDQKEQIAVGKDNTASFRLPSQKVASQKPSVDKGYKQNKLLKGRKKHEEKNNLKLHQDLYGNWSSSGPSGNPYSPQAMQSSPSSVISQERQLHGAESPFYQQISNPFVPRSTYGSIANPFSAMPVLSHIQSSDNQSMLSGFEAPLDNAKPANNATDLKYPTLTPQEKIEKLRRRQKMQAMLAIRKQQQQFSHEISCSDHHISHGSQENQIHQVDEGNRDAEDPGTLPTFDTNSPSEQDDSNTTSLAVNNYSAEDAVLHRLQDVVAKLDIRVRLCIRDSLYRLAQSASQRHSASNTSSTNNSSRDDRGVLKEDNNSRNVKMPEVETESNPIDRTVAHLLFHRPMELSGKRPNAPESPASAKFQSEPKMARTEKSAMECSPRNLQDRHGSSLEGSRTSSLVSDPQPLDQGKTSFGMDITQNVSNTGPADDDAREAEASQWEG